MDKTPIVTRGRSTLPWCYLAAAIVLASLSLCLKPTHWQGGIVMHAMLELVATLLALGIGIVGMTRFFARRETLHLFVGIGFLGAALFDGHHLIMTNPWSMQNVQPEEQWSWNPSMTFLALQLVFGWWACRHEFRSGQTGCTPDNKIYFRLAVLTLLSFTVAVYASIPRRHVLESLVGRPDELLTGTLFLVALLGFVRLSEQSSSTFIRWLVIALLISCVGRFFVMARSHALFDALFTTGHMSKIAMYLCVMIGLLVDFYCLSTESLRGKESLTRAVEELQQEATRKERAQREAAIAHDALANRAAELEQSRAAALNVLQDLEDSRRQAVVAELAMRDQAARTQAILDNASDAIITIDPRGVVESFNRAAERIFGYHAGDVIGRNVSMLMPSPDRERHDQYLQNYLTTGVSKIIGIGREVVGLRADGEAFPMHLAISDIHLGSRRIFTGIVRDVSDMKKTMQQLTAANVELAKRARKIELFNVSLRHSNEDLRQFAYVASHDLQEPLRKITAFCRMLHDDYADQLDDNARMYIKYAVDGAQRMRSLVQDLLAYSRVEIQGKALEPTDADDACAEAIENLGVAIVESAAEVSRTPLPTVLADRAQLVRLFQNLIGNAIKYHSEKPPQIHIAARASKGAWEFRIRDNGIGIEPQYHRRIFVIFQRLHGRDEYTGTGIGLAVCKRIVERAGGRIWVESTEGAGSEFCFTLPVAVAVANQGALSDDQDSMRVVAATHRHLARG